MLHTFAWRVDNHREEVDPPLGGDSTRLGLEPRSHRQLLPLAAADQDKMCAVKERRPLHLREHGQDGARLREGRELHE